MGHREGDAAMAKSWRPIVAALVLGSLGGAALGLHARLTRPQDLAQGGATLQDAAGPLQSATTPRRGGSDAASRHAGGHGKPVARVTAGALRPTTNNAPPLDPVTIDGTHLRYNPYKPSDGPYPVIGPDEHVWIDVSIDQELVYIFNGPHLLYTMITSSGLDTYPGDSTPLGVFHIQQQRGDWFFAPQYNEGAKYWTSWNGHGEFLFHSVPMNKDKQLLVKIAAKLGHPASEGCFHLTIPDAHWFETHIPYRTTVVVEQAPVELLGKQIYHPSAEQKAAINLSTKQDDAGIPHLTTGW
jgi:lipoprotein-anchoring transpeptidase ErfK/SrfK